MPSLRSNPSVWFRSRYTRTGFCYRGVDDRLALDQFKNLILAVMKMSRWPEAGRSAIIKNGELPTAVGGAP
jgi:hypothetical protein